MDDAELEPSELVPSPDSMLVRTICSTISPGTELFCIREAVKSGNSTRPGYILTGKDEKGKRNFLFPAMKESSGCHCDVKAVGKDSILVPLPEGISDEESGFLRFINIGLHAFLRIPKLPEKVCVIGLGPVGNMACQTAQILGCEIIGVDVSDRRRATAGDCGIRSTIRPEDPARKDKEFDLVIDTVCSSSTLASASAILKDHGECSMIGIVKDGDLKASDIMRQIWNRNLVFRSGWEMLNPLKKQAGDPQVSTEDNLLRAINWMKSGLYSVKPLITGVIPAEIGAIKDSYSRLDKKPDENMCFVIRWQ